MRTGRLGTETPQKSAGSRGFPGSFLQLESLVGKRGTRRNRVLPKRVGSGASRLTRKHVFGTAEAGFCARLPVGLPQMRPRQVVLPRRHSYAIIFAYRSSYSWRAVTYPST